MVLVSWVGQRVVINFSTFNFYGLKKKKKLLPTCEIRIKFKCSSLNTGAITCQLKFYFNNT